MKRILSFLVVVVLLSSCGESFKNYRLRVLKTNALVQIEQAGLETFKKGDTVQLQYSDALDSWSIDSKAVSYRDTSYVNSYKTSDTTEHFYFVNYKIAKIEEIQ